MPSRLTALTASIVAALAMPALCQAQQRDEITFYRRATDPMAFDLQLFEPSTSPRSITTVDLATIPGHLSFTIGAWSSYASNVFVSQQSQPATVTPVVRGLWQTEVHASLGLFEYFELGIALPLVYTSHETITSPGGDSDSYTLNANYAGDVRVGDLRGYVKVPLLRGAWPVAVRLGATVPINGADAFAGNLSWTVTPEVIASHEFGPLTAALNLGYRFRQRNGLGAGDPFVLDDEFLWSAGARFAITHAVGVNAEVVGRVGVSAGAPEANRTPIEVLLGGAIQATNGLNIQAGVGRGLTGGYGTPEWRVYLGARLTVTSTRCTNGPEDFDGFEDGDFCGDPDNDNDGIPDVRDRCPNDPEDRDGFLDDDGCPDPDNDADGVTDENDRCPMDPEDHDGFEDADGCPEGDNDHDGVPDGVDQCPMEPEDLDGYQDDDGCPEPGPEAIVVTRTESHLLLSQRVFFDYDSDTIRSVSLPLLNEVARTLRSNVDITRIRVEGYTDGQGDAQYNLDLSYRRARAVVEYLTTQGIPREHLEFQGYGQTHSVADDHTPEGQALNRRVEFTILGQAGHTTTTTVGPAPNSGGNGPRPPVRHHHHSH